MWPNANLGEVKSETRLVSFHPWFFGDAECGKVSPGFFVFACLPACWPIALSIICLLF